MALSAKAARARLAHLAPAISNGSVKSIRQAHGAVGEMIGARHLQQVLIREHPFTHFAGGWVLPKEQRRQGVILYLHGGGFICGDLRYATHVGAFLAHNTGTRVFCPAYRLSPEHPYPAALEDALESYRYLLQKGYSPNQIALFGEGAGGGLCYSLCLRLKALSLPMPGSIVALSPWVNLVPERNTSEPLSLFTQGYCKDFTDPLVSPLLGDLSGLPASLLFAAREEPLCDDARHLQEKLHCHGSTATLITKPDRWHSYVLFGLREDRDALKTINRFLNIHIARENKVRWLQLDNAAKLYPANRRNDWSNIFRLSATLTEPVDQAVMQAALDVTVRRFPSISARLRKGVFWYYLQALEQAPALREEHSYPLTRMSRREMRKCAFRVIVYENRVALELFHSLTDGSGALVFLKSLIAEYLLQKHGIHVPAEQGVVGRLEEPTDGELEDSFQKYGGTASASRKSNNAWRLSGTPEKDAFLNLTCFQLPVDAVVEKAREYGVSVTTFLCACLMMALQNLQQTREPNQLRRKSIKVLIPVNLRNLFPSRTLRNFAMYTTPEIQPRLGWYEFEEICQIVRHRMGLDITPKHMSTMIAANLRSEKILAVRMVPLFLKNLVMKSIFNSVGERKSCITMSNLGQVRLPEEMRPYVSRFDFILGIQATVPNNCGIISYGDSLYINFIRNICEPDLEHQFFLVLQKMGIPVRVQSNQAERS